MIDWLDPYLRSDVVGWHTALLSTVLAFVLAQIISGTYMWTFRGLSYSRNLVQGIVLGSIVTCMLMMAIGNSIAAGIGIAGGLSIIRFRNTMRDPRDIIFIFAALAAGIACGLQAYTSAIVGVLLFAIVNVFLHWTVYGARKQFDGCLIRFFARTDSQIETSVMEALRENCHNFALVTLRQAAQGDFVEHAYQVSIPDPDDRNRLITSLQAIPGVSDVTFFLQEPTLEL